MGGMRNSCCCTIEGRSQLITVPLRSRILILIRIRAHTYRELKGRTLTATLSEDISVVVVAAFPLCFCFCSCCCCYSFAMRCGPQAALCGMMFVCMCVFRMFPNQGGGRAVQFGRLSSECKYLRNVILPRDCSQCILLRYFSLFFLICALLLSSCLLLLLLALLICFCFRCLVQRFIVRHTLRSAAHYNNNLHSTHQ